VLAEREERADGQRRLEPLEPNDRAKLAAGTADRLERLLALRAHLTAREGLDGWSGVSPNDLIMHTTPTSMRAPARKSPMVTPFELKTVSPPVIASTSPKANTPSLVVVVVIIDFT
jgi:hypothetical protein